MEYRNLIVGAITMIILIIIGFGVYRLYQVRIANEADLATTQVETSASPTNTFPSPEPENTPSVQGDASNIQVQPESGLSNSNNLSVYVEFPQSNQLLTSPATIQGYVNTSEFSLNVKDASGINLGSTIAQGCESEFPCQFRATIMFSQPATSTGMLEISASSGLNPQVIPVTF